jgi:hypothetical protein
MLHLPGETDFDPDNYAPVAQARGRLSVSNEKSKSSEWKDLISVSEVQALRTYQLRSRIEWKFCGTSVLQRITNNQPKEI